MLLNVNLITWKRVAEVSKQTPTFIDISHNPLANDNYRTLCVVTMLLMSPLKSVNYMNTNQL